MWLATATPGAFHAGPKARLIDPNGAILHRNSVTMNRIIRALCAFRLVALLIAFTAQAMIPFGYMPRADADRGFRMAFCGNPEGMVVDVRIVRDGEQPDNPASLAGADGICPFAGHGGFAPPLLPIPDMSPAARPRDLAYPPPHVTSVRPLAAPPPPATGPPQAV